MGRRACHLCALCEPTARSQSLRQTPLQWEIGSLVKALNVVAIETFVTDLHPGAQRGDGREFLNGEPDRLRCSRKAAVAQRLSRSALALSHEKARRVCRSRMSQSRGRSAYKCPYAPSERASHHSFGRWDTQARVTCPSRLGLKLCVAAKGLQIALEFAFFDDPLMRLSGAFDAILAIIAFGRKQLCNLVDAACRAAAIDPRSVKYALATLELVLAQVILRLENYDLQADNRKKGGLEARPRAFLLKCITEIDGKGIFWRQANPGRRLAHNRPTWARACLV
jgi:hypothetical protein